MSKLAHSHQPSMDIIEANRMREEGYSEAEIFGFWKAANGNEQPPRDARILYSRCNNCGHTDAPTCSLCMDCYMHSQPCGMEQVTE